MLVARLDDDRRQDRQRQRHLDRRGQAAPGDIVQPDAAADLLDVGAHHVHADAAARRGGRLIAGRQPRLEDQVEPRPLVERAELRRPRRLLRDALRQQLGGIDPLPVVGHLDDDAIARLARHDRQPPGLGLARSPSRLGRLDAMVDRIAHDMDQRIAQQLDHLAVQLDVGAVDRQRHLLAQRRRRIAHQPGQRGKQRIDRLHPRPRDRVAQFGDGHRQAVDCSLQRRIATVAQPPGQLISRQHHLRHAVHHPVEQVDRQPDAARGRTRRTGDRHDHRRELGCRPGLRLPLQRGEQQVLGRIVQRGASVDRLDDLANAVDDRQHGIDQRRIGGAFARPHALQHVLGRMAQPGEPRQVKEAAASLHRVDEAEDRIESCPVGGVRFPRHDFARQRVERFAGFRDEFLQQIVHCPPAMGQRR